MALPWALATTGKSRSRKGRLIFRKREEFMGVGVGRMKVWSSDIKEAADTPSGTGLVREDLRWTSLHGAADPRIADPRELVL
jgi:hypothetical protein